VKTFNLKYNDVEKVKRKQIQMEEMERRKPKLKGNLKQMLEKRENKCEWQRMNHNERQKDGTERRGNCW
jgi:hypothetical protein